MLFCNCTGKSHCTGHCTGWDGHATSGPLGNCKYRPNFAAPSRAQFRTVLPNTGLLNTYALGVHLGAAMKRKKRSRKTREAKSGPVDEVSKMLASTVMGLTPKQVIALNALVAGETKDKAAKAAKIHRNAIQYWMVNDRYFRTCAAIGKGRPVRDVVRGPATWCSARHRRCCRDRRVPRMRYGRQAQRGQILAGKELR